MLRVPNRFPSIGVEQDLDDRFLFQNSVSPVLIGSSPVVLSEMSH